jgi:hypothetical protein
MYPHDMVFDIFNNVKGGLHIIQNSREDGDRSLPVLSQGHLQALVHHISEGLHEGDIQLKTGWNQDLKLFQALKYSVNLKNL